MVYRTLYQAVFHPISSIIWIQRGRGARALYCSFFALGFRQSIFLPSHTCTLSVILALTVFISQTIPPFSLSPCIRPSSFPLALMLMHSQSGCPLSRRALHVHQAVQRPACKWAQIAVHCKLLEISLEGECECYTCEKRRKKWAPAWQFYANENNGDKHYKRLTQSQCLFDVLMQ